ncbi:MAG: iron ABC transporter permease [Coriobacteriales bacterium]|nr:iron ABC transporter permease [Coriobacteriales bacterium]
MRKAGGAAASSGGGAAESVDSGIKAARPRLSGHPRIALALIGGGAVVLVATMAFSLSQGSSSVPLQTVLDAVFSFDPSQLQHQVVIDLRLPRVLASALVGASFAVAGAIMQGTTRNPLADSGIMGLNAGAGFAIAVCYAFFPGLSYLSLILMSFLGAAMSTGLVMGIASLRGGGNHPMRMVLAGAAVSALLAALAQGIALYFDVAQDIMFWTTGGVAGSNWEQLRIMAPFVLLALLAALALSRSVSLLSLGEDVARGLGLNTLAVSVLCAVVVLVLAGASVAVVGAVGFVGLVIPHLARFAVGMDYRWIIPVSAVLGALLVVLADLGARMLNPPFETPIGALIALIGVPFFLYLARKQKRAL